MNPQPETTRRHRAEPAAAILLLLVVPPGVYLAAALAAAGADGSTLAEVACFEPAGLETLPVGRMVAAAVMALSAVAFLFVVPGLLGTLAFMRLPATRRTAYAWSLAANSVALILLCLLLRHTVGIRRAWLAGEWLLWTGVLLALAWRPGEFRANLSLLRKRYGGGLLVGLLTVLVAITVFFPEQFLQCFSEDGTETHELARSLREHFLPHWELETWDLQGWDPESGDPLPRGRMGTVVVNPSLINSYWTCGLQTLLGDGELATRLPYWIWWLAIFAVSYRLARPKGGSPLAAAVLGLSVFLISLLFTFYVGYNPYMADLGNPGVPDALFTLLILLAFDCLQQRDRWGWAISMTLASLVLYAGAVLLVLTLASAWWWQPIERKETLRWGLRGVGMLLAVAAFYLVWGGIDGSLPYWIDTLDIEYVNDYLAAAPPGKSGLPVLAYLLLGGLLFFGYFLLGCGGVAAVGLVLAFRRGAWQRTVATTTLLYLLIVLGSGFKNLHHLGPLLPIPVILFLSASGGEGEKLRRRLCLLAVCSLISCIWLCWPVQRETFTLNRELGLRTTIATDSCLADSYLADSYPTAVQWARMRYSLRIDGLMSWDCDQHTWVAYAELNENPKQPRPLLLTDRSAQPQGYRVLASQRMEGTTKEVRLYVRDTDWTEGLADRRPLRPLVRYPIVFRPLADGTYSPHNNMLEDVQRLRWPW